MPTSDATKLPLSKLPLSKFSAKRKQKIKNNLMCKIFSNIFDFELWYYYVWLVFIILRIGSMSFRFLLWMNWASFSSLLFLRALFKILIAFSKISIKRAEALFIFRTTYRHLRVFTQLKKQPQRLPNAKTQSHWLPIFFLLFADIPGQKLSLKMDGSNGSILF